MSFAAGFLNAWKDNEATSERERLQQEAKDARDSALATTAKNRQEDQEYRASRDATQDKNQLNTLLSGRYSTLVDAKIAFETSKKMPAGHKQNLVFLKDILGDAAGGGDILSKLNQSPKAAAELRATWTSGAKNGFEPRGEQLIEAIGVLAANEDDVNAYREWREGADPVANLGSIDLLDPAIFAQSIAAYSKSMTAPEATITINNRLAFGQGAASQEEKAAEIKIFDNQVLRMAEQVRKGYLAEGPNEVAVAAVAEQRDSNGNVTRAAVEPVLYAQLIEEIVRDIADYKEDSTRLRNEYGQRAFDMLNDNGSFMYEDQIPDFAMYQGQDEPVVTLPTYPGIPQGAIALLLDNPDPLHKRTFIKQYGQEAYDSITNQP